MEPDTEPVIDYKTREDQHNNTYSFIIETEHGEQGEKGLKRFGKWEMRFVIANIGNINTLTISCGITSIAHDLKPSFLAMDNRMLYTEIAKYLAPFPSLNELGKQIRQQSKTPFMLLHGVLSLPAFLL